MADNNNNDEASDAEDDRIISVETEITRLQSDNPKEKLFSITFDKFEDLPSEKGQEVRSSEFSCFGNEWSVTIYPGGDIDSGDGMVGVFLDRCSEGRNLEINFSVGFINGRHRLSRRFSQRIFVAEFESWGWFDFCPCKEITERDEVDEDDVVFLVKGALTIHVSMQLNEFIPRNPASSIMLKLFDDENSADIVFQICEQQKSKSNSDRKRAKISTKKLYHAHRLILQHYSPELSALCATSDTMAPIIITDAKPEIFRLLLYYVYGGEISDEEFVDNEKDFINAANKYGVTNLKLEAEVWYTKNTEITIDNVIDNLLYADAMNCALLNESVMDFIVENKEKVMQRVSFQDVPGDVCKDLLAAVSRCYEEKDSATSGDGDDDETDVEKTYSKMRIRDLREKLNDKGLDIDGSREALIANLKEHY